MDSRLGVTELPAVPRARYLSNSRLFDQPGQRRSSPEPKRCVWSRQRLRWRVGPLHFLRQLLNPESRLSRATRSSEPRRPLRGAGAKRARGGIITGLVSLIASSLRTRSGPRAGLRAPLDIPTPRQARNALEG